MKKTNGKKLLALVLSIVMILGCAPMSIFASAAGGQSEFRRFTVHNSKPILKDGTYYFVSDSGSRLVLGSNRDQNGGVSGSNNFSVSNNVLTTNADAKITVTVVDEQNNTYYFQNSSGQYLQIADSTGERNAKFVNTKTEVKLTYVNGLICIVNTKGTMYLNRWSCGDNFGVWNTGTNDDNSRFTPYREMFLGKASLAGTTEFTITEGDSFSVDDILSKANIVREDDVIIPWTDLSVAYEWDSHYNYNMPIRSVQAYDELDVNNPGEYYLWVYVDDEIAGKITVKVEPETPVTPIQAAKENFTVKVFNYGTAINSYTDGQDSTNFLNFFEGTYPAVDGVAQKDTSRLYYTSQPLLGSDGCPVIYAQGKSRSLGYLFDPNMGAETGGFVQGNGTATEYDPHSNSDYQSMKFDVGNENGSGLFLLNENGYYYYNSQQNAAWFNPETGLFELYDFTMYPEQNNPDDSGGNFFPFNNPVEEGNLIDGNVYQLRGPVKYYEGIVDKSAMNDVWFGLSVEFDFYMPENGLIDGKETKFSFSGDDDVWVYIDDALVLDMGGIHGVYNGSVNFATGEVEYDTNSADENLVHIKTTIADCLRTAYGSSLDSTVLDGDTLADYSKHTIRFFYMERGGNISDCKVEFNVPPIPSGNFEVSKKASGYPDDAEHTFYLTDETGAPIANAEYNGYNLVDTATTFSGQTDSNGMFSIHGDEGAVFGFDVGTKVKVREKKPLAYCETTCEVNGSSYTLNDDLSTNVFTIEANKSTMVRYYNTTVDIEPVAVVVDYGKPITTYPLEKDDRGFNINGITAEAPGEDVKTTDELTLNNGVAVLNESVTPELPIGDLVAEIGVNDTKIFYPGTEKTTTVAYSANLRYQFTDGKIEKYNNFDDEPTTVTEGLEDKRFTVDTVDDNLKYAFYRNGDTIYVMKNPEIIEGKKTVTETVTEYVKVTHEITGQVLEEGNYYFMMKNGTLLLTGSNNSSNGGIVGSGDFSITDNILTTSQDAKIKVTLADKTKNTYYLQNSNNQYLNVTQADSASGATFTNTKTAVRVIYNNGCVVIANASNDYYLNRYGGSGTVYGAYNYIDDGCRFNCYKATTREVELSTDEYFYELTGAGDPIQTTGLSTTAKQILNLNGAVFKATSQSRGRNNYTVSVTGPSNVSIGSLTSNNTSFTYNYSSDDIKDKYGNSISIPITFTRTDNTSISVSYPEYKLVENPYLFKEDEIKMRNTLDSVTYTPFKYMSSIDRVYFYAYKEGFGDGDSANESLGRLFSTITFIPATTVYYEDNFGGSEANGGLYIKYTGDWYTVNDDGTQVKDITAKVDSDEYQDRGEVGDGHTPYGYDSSYDEFNKFSNGTAATIEGKTVNRVCTTYAEFDFTGTGFDIISRTDLDCGMITVFVTKKGEEKGDNVPVINKGVDNLYQIPVISYTGLDYGTYTVKINVSSPQKLLNITGCTFYLDAIRIYDPMGTKSGDNPEFDEANSAYLADKEANAYVASIRDFIIEAAEVAEPSEDGTERYSPVSLPEYEVDGEKKEIKGAVYVDTISNEYDKGDFVFGNIRKKEYTDEQKRWRSIEPEELNTFELVGPNEEVYLKPGYGVGFKIVTDTLPESVQLSIKKPSPKTNTDKATLTVQTYNAVDSISTFNVLSSAEMYYDITDGVKFTQENGKYTAIVILSNGLPTNLDVDDLVSITNLKLTFNEKANVENPAEQNELHLTNLEAPLVGGETETETSNTPNVSLVASEQIYKQVFDTVYVQRIASIPNFDIENFEGSESVCDGGYATVKFNTAKSVKDFEILDENGKAMKLENVQCTVDASKQFTDDYQNTKSWTAKLRVLKNEGNYEFTAKALGGEGESVKLPVTVTPAEIAELRVAKMPAKTEFNFGEEFDFGGLEIEAIYTDDKVEKITEGFEFTESENEHGVKTITATYGDVSVEFDVNVVPVITGIRVGKAPETTEYKYETKLDAKGLELIVTYSDGSEKTVTEGFKLSKDTADTKGKMSVGVEYEGFETSFDVNVKLTFWQKIVRFVKNIITSVKDFFAKIF